ncbi:MAG: hypothetical protein ISR69_08665 [Gammaproteobacteria bacterium]|nr:hypothetical protein [Gammaproteobacteria bacterium]
MEQSLVDELDYSIAVDFVKDKMALVKQTINLVLDLPNSKTVVDPVTGFSIEDMSRAIDDRLKYQLNTIEAPIVQLGITRYPTLTKIYYSEMLYRLMEESNKLDLKATAVQQTLEQYTGYQNENKKPLGNEVLTPSMVSPQFSGDFLDKVINLSSESAEALYKQELSNKLLFYKDKRTEILVKTRALERKINALSISAAKSEDVDVDIEVRSQTINLLNKRIPELLDVLSGYLSASKRIYELLDQESISGNGSLYQLNGSGVVVSGGYFSAIKQSLIVYFIILFLTTIVVVPWKMIRNSKSDEIE